jgi:serine/threonine protein kinase
MLQKIGKYQIVGRVGVGAMGDVYKAFDPILKRSVALKVFSSNLEVTDELRTRFFHEAQAGAMLNHPNIVTVHDLGEEDGCLFIVMELLEGEELRQLIARRRTLSLEEKLSVMVQVCKGVEYAHRKGVIHRDIKPGNIFVLTNDHVKLLDFGVARLAAMDTGLTRAGLIMGTVRYMSPEQCRGRADHRSDIFSVGAVFYELLAYRPAFTGDDTFGLLDQVQHAEPLRLRDLDSSLPENLAATVHRALRKEPSERFLNIGDMRIELEQIQHQLLEEADRTRARVRTSLHEVHTLEHALAERSGAVEENAAVSADVTGPLMSLQRLDEELGTRIDRLRSQLDQAHSVEPLLEQAVQLARSEEYDTAIAMYRRVLVQMPEHARASLGLRHAEEERQRRIQAAGRFDQAVRTDDGRDDPRDDLTVLDTRVPEETADDDRTDAAHPRPSRWPWLGGGALVAAVLLAGVYWLSPMPARQSLPWEARPEQVLPKWKAALLAWLPDAGRRTASGAKSPPAVPEPAARRTADETETRQPVDRATRAPSATPADVQSEKPASAAVERGTESSPPLPRKQDEYSGSARAVEPVPSPVPERPAAPVELPPRSMPTPPDRGPVASSTKPKEAPAATPAPPSNSQGDVVHTPSAPMRTTPRPTPSPPRSPMPALASNATLDETVAWLTQVLAEHAKTGQLPSGVMYRVNRLDGCRIEWGAHTQTGAGYQLTGVLNSLDPDRTSVSQQDGGWIIDLQWVDKSFQEDQRSRKVGDDSFAGLLVWFPEVQAAKTAASAFTRAIRLCAR